MKALNLNSPLHKLTLTGFPRLRSLFLSDQQGIFAISSQSLVWLSELLSTATDSCRLEEIYIRSELQMADQSPPASDWLIIDESFTSNMMSYFRNLTLECANKYHILREAGLVSKFQDKLEQIFPNIHARGFLHVLRRGSADV